MKKWVSVDSTATLAGFWRAASVYINKPHVANRRLCGTKILIIEESDDNLDTISRRFSENKPLDVENESLVEIDLTTFDHKRRVIVRELLPKNADRFPTVREVVVFDPEESQVYFKPVCYVGEEQDSLGDKTERDIEDEIAYCFKYNQNEQKVSLGLEGGRGDVRGQVSARWLEETLLAKVGAWAAKDQLKTSVTSLRLVPLDLYSALYSKLKAKYGQELVKVWPEKTDPQKYVYEDVAIATYLLLLWREERERKQETRLQSFVDLGCGNGLLVHILTSEGHPGQGIDIRRRNIWDMYGPNIVLKEMAITPSADNLFPDYDWIIGNHSDELTPWIPVIAARSSYQCSYLVLPCCPHDFHGRYSHRGHSSSQYRGYLDFVTRVGEVCGFSVEEDTLRIPSTKRVCFVGRSRTYDKSEEAKVDQQRTEFINSRLPSLPVSYKRGHSYTEMVAGSTTGIQSLDIAASSPCDSHSSHAGRDTVMDAWDDLEEDGAGSPCMDTRTGDGTEQWSAKFQTRSGTEAVRNCQTVNKDTQAVIVRRVFEEVMEAPDADTVELEEGCTWRKGGSVALGDVAQLFDQSVLQQLKSECGGLQTLLRNHNNIFQVSGGRVRLRDLSSADPWSKRTEAKRRRVDVSDKVKTRLCWFHDHHPDGCPRPAPLCQFAHGPGELRPCPPPSKTGRQH